MALTVKEMLLGVIEHVCVLQAGKLALEPPQVALPSACCCVLGLLEDAPLLLACHIFDALKRPASKRSYVRRLRLLQCDLPEPSRLSHGSLAECGEDWISPSEPFLAPHDIYVM